MGEIFNKYELFTIVMRLKRFYHEEPGSKPYWKAEEFRPAISAVEEAYFSSDMPAFKDGLRQVIQTTFDVGMY